MSDLWIAIIAASAAILAAILSSVLTSSLTHYFEHQQRRKEYELKWLDERFGPALDFLGRILANVSNTPTTPEGRGQIRDEIHRVVAGPSKESNAWCIAVLLDPEDTGLRDTILSSMTYAQIGESNAELVNYQVRLHLSLEELAEEFRRERQAIVKGKSLESLIRERKTKLDKTTREFSSALLAVRAFLNGEGDLDSTLTKIKNSGVRGKRLKWVFKILDSDSDQQKLTLLGKVRRECEENGWLSERQK